MTGSAYVSALAVVLTLRRAATICACLATGLLLACGVALAIGWHYEARLRFEPLLWPWLALGTAILADGIAAWMSRRLAAGYIELFHAAVEQQTPQVRKLRRP